MSLNEFLSLIAGILGGGILTTLLTIWHRSYLERKSRRVQFIRDQVDNLYAPVYFWATLSSRLLILYVEECKSFSVNLLDQRQKNKQILALSTEEGGRVNVSDKYLQQVNDNIIYILEIIENQYSFSDKNDHELFNRFVVIASRIKAEIDVLGGGEISYEIKEMQREADFILKKFSKAVGQKLDEKKSELEKLMK